MNETFLNREITIKKTDGTFVRGKCTKESSIGLTLIVSSSKRIVFIPLSQVSEIILGVGGEDDKC